MRPRRNSTRENFSSRSRVALESKSVQISVVAATKAVGETTANRLADVIDMTDPGETGPAIAAEAEVLLGPHLRGVVATAVSDASSKVAKSEFVMDVRFLSERLCRARASNRSARPQFSTSQRVGSFAVTTARSRREVVVKCHRKLSMFVQRVWSLAVFGSPSGRNLCRSSCF